MSGCTHNCDEGRRCTCQPAPDRLALAIGAHILQASDGLHLSAHHNARHVQHFMHATWAHVAGLRAPMGRLVGR